MISTNGIFYQRTNVLSLLMVYESKLISGNKVLAYGNVNLIKNSIFFFKLREYACKFVNWVSNRSNALELATLVLVRIFILFVINKFPKIYISR